MEALPPALDRSLIWPDPFPAVLLAIAERGIRVADLATMSLWTVLADAPAGEVKSELEERGFDVAPLQDDVIWRYVKVGDLDRAAQVDQLAVPIRTNEIIHESVGLITALEALATRPFFFVMRGRGVHGVLTRSDVQRSPVTMAALGLVLALEQGLKQLVRVVAAETWTTKLSARRLQPAEATLEDRRRHNADIDLIECVQLADLFDIAAKEPMIQKRFSLSKAEIRKTKTRIVRARDSMAHGGSLLNADPDPEGAIGLFMEIRRLAEQIWSIDQVRNSSGRA